MVVRSRNNLANQLPVNVGEAVVAPAMVKRQTFVVQAKQVQDGRLQIMDMRGAVGNVEAKFISSTESDATLDTTACHPEAKRLRMMISPL